MSIRIMTQVWELELHDSEMLIMLALADWANDEGECWPSIAQIAKKTRKSERTIQTAIKSMVTAGHITRLEIVGKGCRYILHPRKDCPPQPSRPAEAAPPQSTAQTPAAVAPNTSVTTNTSPKASPSTRTRAGKRTQKRRWPADMPPPASVSDDQWAGFIENRRRQRASLTPRAYQLLIDKLAEHSNDEWPPGRIVDLMTERGWRSFEPDWIRNATESPDGQRPKHPNNRSRRYRDPLLDRYAGGEHPDMG